MSRNRHRPEEIVAKLRQVEVLTAQGRFVAEAIRSIGVTEVSSGTSCSTARSSPRSRRPRSSSRAGVGTTTRSARPRPLAPSRPPRRSCCGRLRGPNQLRRPPRPWRSGLSCTNMRPGPLHRGRPLCASPDELPSGSPRNTPENRIEHSRVLRLLSYGGRHGARGCRGLDVGEHSRAPCRDRHAGCTLPTPLSSLSRRVAPDCEQPQSTNRARVRALHGARGC
jgi:putative transposase